MIALEELIGNLLLQHNCVIVPHFGGFVAKQSSAQIDYRNGVMLPPRKSLLFNRNLVQNDGLLIAEYAQKNTCSYSEAEKIVKAKVDSWFENLRDGNRVAIDKVGFLFVDAEKNIGFEQDRFFNLLMSSFGMGKVHFVSEEEVESVQKLAEIKPIKAAEVQQIQPSFEKESTQQRELVEETIDPKAKVVTLPTSEFKRSKTWRYIAAACLLPIAFYSFWIPMKTDVLESGIISVNDFNPFHQSTEGDYKPEDFTNYVVARDSTVTLESQLEKVESNSSYYMYNFAEDFFIPVKLGVKEESPTAPVEVNKEDNTIQGTSINKSGSHLIVGCFGSKENADNLVAQLNRDGFSAQIIDQKGGLYRVSCGSANSDSSLQDLRSSASAKGYTGWVLKK